MLAAISSATLFGVHGSPVRVEVHVGGRGLPGYRLVGQPDAVCRESRDRVRAAVMSSELSWPDKPIVVNLAPSGVRKSGAGLDLAIAVGVLASDGQVPLDAVARLRLPGRARPRRGTATGVGGRPDGRLARTRRGRHGARQHGRGARRGEGCGPHRARSARRRRVPRRGAGVGPRRPAPPTGGGGGGRPRRRARPTGAAARPGGVGGRRPPPAPRRSAGQRQDDARPALARPAARARPRASARHHDGPLRRRPAPPVERSRPHATVPGAAPHLVHHRARRRRVAAAAPGRGQPGAQRNSLPRRARRVLAPVVGGAARAAGGGCRPGHACQRPGGDAGVLPARRAPPTRARAEVAPPGACECDDVARARYLRRLSGPLSDRFDLRVVVHKPAVDDLLEGEPGEPSAVVRRRVAAARARALERSGKLNGALGHDELDEVAPLDREAKALLRDEIEHDRLTGRGYHRVRRVARTIADLAARDDDRVDARRRRRWRCRCAPACARGGSRRSPNGGRRDRRPPTPATSPRSPVSTWRRWRGCACSCPATTRPRPGRWRAGGTRRTRRWRRCSRPSVRAAWRRAVVQRDPDTWARPVRPARHPRRERARSRLSDAAPCRPAAAGRAVRQGELGRPRPPPRRHRRHAQRHRARL